MTLSAQQPHLHTLHVGLAVHNADWNWSDVCSPFARLYCVSKGKAQIVLPSGTYDLRPHHLYFIPAFTLHSCICHSYFEHYYLHLYESSLPGISLLNHRNFPVEQPANDLDPMLFKRLCELNPAKKLAQPAPARYDSKGILTQHLLKDEQCDLPGELESTGIVYQLVSRFLKNARTEAETGDVRIRKILAYIQQNIHTSMDIDSLSGLSCLSKDHFIRLFKREMKITPIQYINRKKMEKAQLMLTTQNTPVKNIAYLLGYDNCAYFTRIFKKELGVTPQEYKRNLTCPK